MNYDYYWNNIPGVGLSRNNLIYTSLISEDKKTFVQWYYNDVNYHKDQNEVIDPEKMELKWQREIKYLTLMSDRCPNLVPRIIDVNDKEKKIYLEIDGLDFWNRAGCLTENYDSVLPDWQEQMLSIIQAHRDIGLYKYSMHPSSYFIVDGKLKSINYFFVYDKSEGPISIADHSSHIHSNRQAIMRTQVEAMGLDWYEPQSLNKLQELCFESFRTNYPSEFIEKAKEIYHD
jgi:hypothetical protein